MTESAKREWTPDQILEKHIRSISNRQMSNRLRRLSDGRGLKLKKAPLSNTDKLWASVLSIVFDSTRETGGKMDAYLR